MLFGFVILFDKIKLINNTVLYQPLVSSISVTLMATQLVMGSRQNFKLLLPSSYKVGLFEQKLFHWIGTLNKS